MRVARRESWSSMRASSAPVSVCCGMSADKVAEADGLRTQIVPDQRLAG